MDVWRTCTIDVRELNAICITIEEIVNISCQSIRIKSARCSIISIVQIDAFVTSLVTNTCASATMPTHKAQVCYCSSNLQMLNWFVSETQVNSSTHTCWFNDILGSFEDIFCSWGRVVEQGIQLITIK